jgi:hypothetical protein
MMQLGVPIGGSRQSMANIPNNKDMANMHQPFQKSQQNFSMNIGLNPSQQAAKLQEFHQSYRNLNQDQLTMKNEPPGGRGSQFRSPQH